MFLIRKILVKYWYSGHVGDGMLTCDMFMLATDVFLSLISSGFTDTNSSLVVSRSILHWSPWSLQLSSSASSVSRELFTFSRSSSISSWDWKHTKYFRPNLPEDAFWITVWTQRLHGRFTVLIFIFPYVFGNLFQHTCAYLVVHTSKQ